MARERPQLQLLERLLAAAFWPLGEAEITWRRGAGEPLGCRVGLGSKNAFELLLTPRERITPQMAYQLFQRIRVQAAKGSKVTPLAIAPVISPRVAEIAQRHQVSWLDHAGNYRIVNPAVHLYLAQAGRKPVRADDESSASSAVDIFSPRSSRIVRALLENPGKSWQVAQLASDPAIDVSLGLASRVKQALVEQNYATIRQRLLYLTQPSELLAAWARLYRGPVEERLYYLRGDVNDIEHTVARWCERQGLTYALARYSAAARLAPGLRYSLASIYVDPEFFTSAQQQAFSGELGAQRVDSGATLALLTPYDASVFVGRQKLSEQVTSPLQTWLDLQGLAGRGPETAEALFNKFLQAGLTIPEQKGGAT